VSHHNLRVSLFTDFRAWWKSKLNFNLQSKCDGSKKEKHAVTPLPVRMLLRVYIVCFHPLGYDSGNAINRAARIIVWLGPVLRRGALSHAPTAVTALV
jgi:hypothetical protein